MENGGIKDPALDSENQNWSLPFVVAYLVLWIGMFVFLIAGSRNAWSKYRELGSYGGCKSRAATVSHSDKQELRYPLHRKPADPWS